MSSEKDAVRAKDAVRLAGQQLLDRIAGVMSRVEWADFLELADRLPRARQIFVWGAGRSGLVARSFGMRLMHAGLTAFIPGETITPATGPGDLLVAISCTGKTGISDYFVQRARQLGANVVVITSDADSPMARDGDKTVLVPADDDDIVFRAAVFEHATSLCLDAVFNVLSERLKLDNLAFWQRHANLE